MDTIPITSPIAAGDIQQFDYRYRFGNAEFDESTFILTVGGQPAEVEHRALEVLACLLRHAGEVVTKEELFREVWAGRVTVDKVLPNAINKLRKALGPANSELLVTQPRLGYRFTGVTERVVARSRTPSALVLVADSPAPLRPHYMLRKALGGSRGSEVWLTQHVKTGERRVYKYAASAGRLRSLRREATLARILASEVPETARDGFARLIDWHFEGEPFFLEYEYGGSNLLEWSRQYLRTMERPARLSLFLQIADAVAAAHQVGILHKDIKPANVLISPLRDQWHVRLTDFGSGGLLDPERLDELGITRHDLATTRDLGSSSGSGTPMYLAPEVVAGQVQTVQSDVYALGLILYQLLAGDLGRPMAPGWEKDIDDALLREDIASATDGNPAHRLGSVPELTLRLRRLEERRRAAELADQATAKALQAQQVLARARARRPFVIASLVLLAIGLVATSWLWSNARHARNVAEQANAQARRELEKATAINAFLNEDVIGLSNPLIGDKGADAPLKDILLAARDRIDVHFKSQPEIAASVHTSVAQLFNSLMMIEPAEQEVRRSLALYEATNGPDDPLSVRTRASLIGVLTRTGKFDEARQLLQAMQNRVGPDTASDTRMYLALGWGQYYANRGELEQAIAPLEEGVHLMEQNHADNTAVLDSNRLDLGQLYNAAGRHAKAQKLAEHALQDMLARPKRNELQIAIARQVLADAYSHQKQYDRAEPLLLEAQRTVSAALGADSINNAMLLDGLAYIARKREDWPKALLYLRQSAEISRKRLGETHPTALLAQGNLGQSLFLSGDPRAAEAVLEPVYAQLATLYPDGSPQKQTIGFWYACSEAALGKFGRTDQVLAALDTGLVDDTGNAETWKLKLDLLRGVVLAGNGKQQSAAPLLERALHGLRDDPEVERQLLQMASNSADDAHDG